ncbi:RNA polymerase factor sigma-32 [Maricaulis sp. CAU 1757]
MRSSAPAKSSQTTPPVTSQAAVDGDRRFVRNAMSRALLDREEEAELARLWRDERDEPALHRLTEAHMRLVVATATRFKRYGLPVADLIQEGHIGLMKAAEKFEPERGFRFSTYASWWIRSCIQDFVLRNWSIVRTGTTSAQKTLFFNLRRLRAQIGDLDNSGLTPERRDHIAEELRVKRQDVDFMADRLSRSDRSLNAPVGDDEQSSMQDFLVDEAPAPEEEVMARTDGERRSLWLGQAIATLSEREQLVIRERRLGEDTVTLETLGRTLGVSKERVRQIEAAALGKLKRQLTEIVGDPAEAGLLPSG